MKPQLLKISVFVTLSSLCLFGAGCFGKSPAPSQTGAEAEPKAATTTPLTATSSNAATVGGTSPSQATTNKGTVIKPSTTTPKPKTTIVPAPVANTVVITSASFSPQIIAIKAGDTVVWVNRDTVPHTTKSDGSLLWDSGSISPGKSYSHVFKSPGSYNYSCAIHPTVKGTVIVR